MFFVCAKGKAHAAVYMETLVSSQLSAQAPAAMCMEERVCNRRTEHNKDYFGERSIYLCVYVYLCIYCEFSLFIAIIIRKT